MMKKLKINMDSTIMRSIILAITLFAVGVICALQSCNPVRRVITDPRKFQQVASEVIRRRYCITDTSRRISEQESTRCDSVTTSATVDIVTLPGKDSFTATSTDGTTVSRTGSTLTITSKLSVKTIIRTRAVVAKRHHHSNHFH